MPNQNDPTQNPNPVNPPVDQPASQTFPPVPPTVFPQSDLPPLPPAFQNMPETETTSPTVGQSPVPAANSDSGSSAPPEISSVLPKAKKKFGGGRIIATILGLIVLVGGIGAGILVTQQPQLFQQKAKIVECQSNSECSAGWKCVSGGCSKPVPTPFCSRTCLGNQYCAPDTNGGTCKTDITKPAPTPFCSRTCLGNQYCAPDTNGGTCKTDIPKPAASPSTVADGQCLGPGQECTTGNSFPDNSCIPTDTRCGTKPATTTTSASCNNIPQSNSNYTGTITIPSDLQNCYLSHYWCKNLAQAGGGCDTSNGQLLSTGAKTATINKSCGVEQVDLYCPACGWGVNMASGARFYSKTWGAACSEGTTSQTLVAPSCLAVNIYSSAWGAIPVAERSSLTAGTSINFCVAGTTSSGTFDKARFTINGTTLAETTAVRPGSTDFCQVYVIPTGVTTFNVSAEIHHATEGWF